MAIQLTPEQEKRIQAVIDTGAYSSAEEALEAALSAAELAAETGFDGSQEELESLLLAGLASPGLSEEEFWGEVDRETNRLLGTSKPSSRA